MFRCFWYWIALYLLGWERSAAARRCACFLMFSLFFLILLVCSYFFLYFPYFFLLFLFFSSFFSSHHFFLSIFLNFPKNISPFSFFPPDPDLRIRHFLQLCDTLRNVIFLGKHLGFLCCFFSRGGGARMRTRVIVVGWVPASPFPLGPPCSVPRRPSPAPPPITCWSFGRSVVRRSVVPRSLLAFYSAPQNKNQSEETILNK